MKKWLFSILVLLSFLNTSNCQKSFKVMAGITMSSLILDPDNPNNSASAFNEDLDYKAVVGQAFGLQYSVAANEKVNVNFGLQFSPKGTEEVNGDLKLSLNYLKYIQSFDAELVENVSLGAGIFWGRAIFTHHINKLDYQSFYSDDWDYGFSIHLAYAWKRYSVRAIYFHSASTVLRRVSSDMPFSSFFHRLNYKHRTVQLMVSYNFLAPKEDKIEASIE